VVVTVSDWENPISDAILGDPIKKLVVKIAEESVGLGWMTPSLLHLRVESKLCKSTNLAVFFSNSLYSIANSSFQFVSQSLIWGCTCRGVLQI
jgi:hypothetical protein